MKKPFKWLALTSTLVLSSYLAQNVQANEVEPQTNVLESTAPSSNAPASSADSSSVEVTSPSQEDAQASSTAPSGETLPETSPSSALTEEEASTGTGETADSTGPATAATATSEQAAPQTQASDQNSSAAPTDDKQEQAAPEVIVSANNQPDKPLGKISVVNQNAQTGSFDVVISDVYAPEGVAEVKVPIWSSANDQDDVKWYTATKQIDDTYKVAVSISNHKNNLAEYNIHLYYVDRKGKLLAVSGTKTQVSRSSNKVAGTLTTQPANAQTGDFEVTVSNIYAPSGLKSVILPIWSDANNQDDLKWYRATAQADGTYKALVKLADHKNNQGTYHVHLYYEEQNNNLTPVGGITTQTRTAKPTGKIAISNNNQHNGSFDITVSEVGNIAGVKEVIVPVWSEVNGQNDIIWYQASKQADGTYRANVTPANHKFETGLYNAHLYYKQNDDSLIAVSGTQTQVAIAPATGKITTFNHNSQTGSFDIRVSEVSSGRGIAEVIVPVWAEDKGQNDIKWYSASRQADGTYTVSVKPGDHNYESGLYHTHLYYKENDGQMRAVSGTQTQVKMGNPAAKLAIHNVNDKTGSFDVIITDIVAPAGLKTVEVPVWSDAGGQEDIIWYHAVRQADGSYKASVSAANHRYTDGLYHAHLYLIDGSGKRSDRLATSTATLKLPPQTGLVTISPVSTNTASFDVTVTHVGAKAGVKDVQIGVWTEGKGQDDLRWYLASRQSDGSYKARIRISNHDFSNGLYHVHTYYTLNNNQFVAVDGSATQVNMPAPRAHIQQELAALHNRFNQLFAGVGGHKSLYITPADGNESLLLNNGTQRSASTIKLFVLASFYAKVARGEINPNQAHTVNPAEIVTASVNLSNAGGRTFSLAQLANYMVQTSDNTATNIIMRHIGGVDAVNTEIRRLGYTQTRMERYMHDAAAINAGKDNYIAAQEAGDLIKNIYNKTLINPGIDTTMLNNLGNNYYPLWLTADIKDKATVYDKPGNHTGHGVENDIAVIAKNGRAYIVALLTQGAWNQNTAIKNFGSAVYNELVN